MDKRLFLLLLCAYICLAGFLLVFTKDYTLPKPLSSYTGLVTFCDSIVVIVGMIGLIGGITGIFIVIGLCGILSIMAIVNMVSKHQVVDSRYFTRCFIYRVAFLLWPILICFVLFRMVQTGDPDHGGDAMWPIIPTLAASLALNVTMSLHVISGLAACKKQKIITGGNLALHVFMQLCCGFDFISSLILMLKEWVNHPNERVGFLSHVFMKRTMLD